MSTRWTKNHDCSFCFYPSNRKCPITISAVNNYSADTVLFWPQTSTQNVQFTVGWLVTLSCEHHSDWDTKNSWKIADKNNSYIEFATNSQPVNFHKRVTLNVQHSPLMTKCILSLVNTQHLWTLTFLNRSSHTSLVILETRCWIIISTPALSLSVSSFYFYFTSAHTYKHGPFVWYMFRTL